jgi:hypothetical protein
MKPVVVAAKTPTWRKPRFRTAVFCAKVNPNPRAGPPEREVQIPSIMFGEFDLCEPARLEAAWEGGRYTLRWRELNVEFSGANSAEVFDQFRSYVIRHANDPNIEPLLKPLVRGEPIRAFKPAEA